MCCVATLTMHINDVKVYWPHPGVQFCITAERWDFQLPFSFVHGIQLWHGPAPSLMPGMTTCHVVHETSTPISLYDGTIFVRLTHTCKMSHANLSLYKCLYLLRFVSNVNVKLCFSYVTDFVLTFLSSCLSVFILRGRNMTVLCSLRSHNVFQSIQIYTVVIFIFIFMFLLSNIRSSVTLDGSLLSVNE